MTTGEVNFPEFLNALKTIAEEMRALRVNLHSIANELQTTNEILHKISITRALGV